MKTILSLIISAALVVSGYSQTRNVLVGTNNAVAQPTNFWSADASNARIGLGLGTAATNPASAFQPASLVLSNLTSSNAVNLTNLQATNLVGVIPSSNIPSTTLTNIGGTLAIGSGGTGATNATSARQNLGSTAIGDALFIATNAAAARTTLGATTVGANIFTLSVGLGSTNFLRINADNTVSAISATDMRSSLLLGTAATNATTNFQAASSSLTSLSTNNGVDLTNIPVAGVVGALATNGNGFGLTNLNASNITGQIPASNISSVSLSNVSGSLNITSGGTAATNAGGARTNLGLGATWLTNTNVTNFRTAIGLGTNAQPVFDGASITGDLFAGSLEVATGSNSTAVTADGIEFTGGSASTTRTNLGLGWSALTNTNAGTGLVSVNTNGEVVSPTNFWQVSPANTRVQLIQPVTTSTNTATNARNLYLYSLAISTVGVTNTIQLPTNGGTLLGDVATVIHEGPTSSVTAVRQIGSGTNIISISQFQDAIKFIYEAGGWRLADNLSFIEPIYFSGTNASANAAESRTNLGLGTTNDVQFGRVFVNGVLDVYSGVSGAMEVFKPILIADRDSTNAVFQFEVGSDAAIARTNLGIPLAALTNTSVTNFQKAIFHTNAAPTGIGGNLGTVAAWIEIVASNGVTYKVPVYTNVP